MSVYYEALLTSRFLGFDWAPTSVPRRGGGVTRKSCKGIRAALRRVKRWEAEERNADTPHERTKRHRRELERLEAPVTNKDAATEARWVG